MQDSIAPEFPVSCTLACHLQHQLVSNAGSEGMAAAQALMVTRNGMHATNPLCIPCVQQHLGRTSRAEQPKLLLHG